MPSPACWSSSEQQYDCQIYDPNLLLSMNLLRVHFVPSLSSFMKTLPSIMYHWFYRNPKKETTVSTWRAPTGFTSPASHPVAFPVSANSQEPTVSIPPSSVHAPVPPQQDWSPLPTALLCPARALLNQSWHTGWCCGIALACYWPHGPARPSQAGSSQGAWSWTPPIHWLPMHPRHHDPAQPSLNLVLALPL